MAEVVLDVVRSRTEIDPDKGFVEYYEVEFHIDSQRYYLRMSPEGWTADKAEKAVQEKAKELLAIKGKKLTIAQSK